MVGNGSQPTTPDRKVFIMSKVTTYQDLLNNDHAALMAECATLYPAHTKLAPKVKHMRRRVFTPRPVADMLREYEAQLAATSINMINFSSTPWS